MKGPHYFMHSLHSLSRPLTLPRGKPVPPLSMTRSSSKGEAQRSDTEMMQWRTLGKEEQGTERNRMKRKSIESGARGSNKKDEPIDPSHLALSHRKKSMSKPACDTASKG